MQRLESLRPTDDAIDAEFTPQRQRALYQDVLAKTAHVIPMPVRRRWPGVAAAVAAVLAIGVGGVYVAGLDTGEPVTEPLPPNIAPSVESAGVPPEPDPEGIVMPDLAAGVVVSPVVLSGIADAAEASPAREGAFLHVVTVEEQSDHQGEFRTRHNAYVDAEGWTWRYTSREINMNEFEEYESNYWLLHPGPGEWPETLSTDPQQLDAQLRAGTGNHSEDERVFKNIHEILLTETAAPELRSAAIRVLQGLAENPQDPAPAKEGMIASPQVAVYEVTLPDGGTGYRATIVDPTSRPGEERSLVLDGTGQIAEANQTFSDGHFRSNVVIREWVDQLPAEFTETLGAERVYREIDE